LDLIFKPASVAVVGASRNLSYVTAIWQNARRLGFPGPVYAVNPNYDRIGEEPCYPSLVDVPGPVDLAIVGVPARLLPGVLEQAAARGVGALDIITAGFAELPGDEGPRRQAALRSFADETGIRIVGPNCFGVLSAPASMLAYPGTYARLIAGPMAVVLQSGQMVPCLLTPCFDRGIGFQYVVSTGNEVDLEAADFLRYFVEDPRTRVLGCYIEQFRTPAKLLEVAELAAELRKPIVAVKVGRSEGAHQALQAHTAALAGSDDVIDAVMRQRGITRVKDVDEMIETLAAFHTRTLPRGDRVAAITLSGAVCGLIHDLAGEAGVTFPPLLPETVARLEQVVPDYVNIGNPLDITGIGVLQPDIFAGAVAALGDADNVDVVAYVRGVPSVLDVQTHVGKSWVDAVARHPEKLFLIVSIVGGELHPLGTSLAELPAEPVAIVDGVPFLQGLTPSLKAIGALIRYSRFLDEREPRWAGTAEGDVAPRVPGSLSLGDQLGTKDAETRADRARALVRAAGLRPLTEREGKEILALYDIPTTREQLVTSLEDARQAARAIGYPVALKVDSPQIVHKTEAGALLLDVPDDAGLECGFAEVVENARRHNSNAEIRGVLVQEMVRGGHEVILGMKRDPDFGPVIVVGLGGIFVEVLRDVALRLPPLTAGDAGAMIDTLRAAPLLRGVRGRPPADAAALVEAIVRFSELCLDLQGVVSEIDVNPLMVFAGSRGVQVVDCLMLPAGLTATKE
jgi:acetyltransferase